MSEELIGNVTHYFSKSHVAGIHLDYGELTLGDLIHVVGHTSDFIQRVESMQIEHEPVQVAHEGDEIGIRVFEHAREHDKVYRVAAQ